MTKEALRAVSWNVAREMWRYLVHNSRDSTLVWQAFTEAFPDMMRLEMDRQHRWRRINKLRGTIREYAERVWSCDRPDGEQATSNDGDSDDDDDKLKWGTLLHITIPNPRSTHLVDLTYINNLVYLHVDVPEFQSFTRAIRSWVEAGSFRYLKGLILGTKTDGTTHKPTLKMLNSFPNLRLVGFEQDASAISHGSKEWPNSGYLPDGIWHSPWGKKTLPEPFDLKHLLESCGHSANRHGRNFCQIYAEYVLSVMSTMTQAQGWTATAVGCPGPSFEDYDLVWDEQDLVDGCELGSFRVNRESFDVWAYRRATALPCINASEPTYTTTNSGKKKLGAEKLNQAISGPGFACYKVKVPDDTGDSNVNDRQDIYGNRKLPNLIVLYRRFKLMPGTEIGHNKEDKDKLNAGKKRIGDGNGDAKKEKKKPRMKAKLLNGGANGGKDLLSQFLG